MLFARRKIARGGLVRVGGIRLLMAGRAVFDLARPGLTVAGFRVIGSPAAVGLICLRVSSFAVAVCRTACRYIAALFAAAGGLTGVNAARGMIAGIPVALLNVGPFRFSRAGSSRRVGRLAVPIVGIRIEQAAEEFARQRLDPLRQEPARLGARSQNHRAERLGRACRWSENRW